MKKVEAYETSNGLLFLNEDEAVICEKQLNLEEFIVRLVENKCWYDMSKDDISRFILDNIDEMIKIATE